MKHSKEKENVLAEVLREPYLRGASKSKHVMSLLDPKLRLRKGIVCNYCKNGIEYKGTDERGSHLFSKKAKGYTKYYHISCAERAGFDIEYRKRAGQVFLR